jgi:S-DNA-T family DNA segregation ATPase FtsK/SpoIIIE
MSKRKKDSEQGSRWHHSLDPETKQSIWAILFFVAAVVFILAIFGKAGALGERINWILILLFGKAVYLVPAALALMGLSFLIALHSHIMRTSVIGGAIFLFSALGLTDVIFAEHAAGYVGFIVAYPLQRLFDSLVSEIIFTTFLVISIMIMVNAPLRLRLWWRNKPEVEKEEAKSQVQPVLASTEKPKEEEEETDEAPAVATTSAWMPQNIFSTKKIKKVFQNIPLDLLEGDKGKAQGGDIKASSNIIKRTLQNFGIDVEMSEVNVGPSVTQYTLRPAEGVKLSKILALQNDLALALSAHPLRIEAPIPGRPLVGIEVPNKAVSTVGLKSLLSSDEFQGSEKPLLLALGRNVSGQAIYADLAGMPHLLIAGSTGSGKSVALHSVMMSLLYRNTPDKLKLILIDPKRVELTTYGGVPHLLAPVVIDAKKAIMALKWAVKEMERRYEVLSARKVRDLKSYHEAIKEDDEADPLPYIVVVIDELADIMATYPRELEASIIRLAQMSRAVGIHLIVSTQRPSVEVITGLIKANITTRIAFRVASQIDSRTILDMSGSEKLLGNGDMLFLSGDSTKPVRVQGTYVSVQEIKRVTQYIEEEYGATVEESSDVNFSKDENAGAVKAADWGGAIPSGANSGSGLLQFDEMAESDVDDDMFEEARELVIESGKASTSFLQRRLKLGYARAARLMDILEDKGIVGPGNGAKPREVLVSRSNDNGENVMPDTI